MSIPETPPPATKPGGSGGVGMIVGGIAVFIVCSIIQGAGGSSMFSQSYYPPDNAFMDLLMNLTWWPGWIVTVVLIIGGVRQLMQSKK